MAKGSYRERKLLSLDRSSTGVEKIPDSSYICFIVRNTIQMDVKSTRIAVNFENNFVKLYLFETSISLN